MMTRDALDAQETPGMETELGAAESGWQWGCPRESEQIWEREGRRARSWGRVPLGQRKRCPKGAPNMQPEAGDNLRGGYNSSQHG